MIGTFKKADIQTILYNACNNDEKLLNNLLGEAKYRNKERYASCKAFLKNTLYADSLPIEDVVMLYVLACSYDESLESPLYYFEQEELDYSQKFYSHIYLRKKITAEGIETNFDDSFSGANTQRKLEFIHEKYGDQKSVVINNIASYFISKIGNVEYKYQKDVCEMSVKELEEVLNMTNPNSFSVQKAYLINYLEWCVDKGIIAEDHIVEVRDGISFETVDNFDVFKKFYFFSKKELNDYLSSVIPLYDAISKVAYENIPKIIIPTIWLSWIGFRFADEIFEIKREDVDISTRTIACQSTGKSISGIDEDIFNEIIYRKVHDPDCKLINLDGKEEELKNFKLYVNSQITNMNRAAFDNGITHKRLMIKKVFDSGVCNRLYDYENTLGRALAFKDYSDIMSVAKERDTTSTNKASQLLSQYRKWKLAKEN